MIMIKRALPAHMTSARLKKHYEALDGRYLKAIHKNGAASFVITSIVNIDDEGNVSFILKGEVNPFNPIEKILTEDGNVLIDQDGLQLNIAYLLDKDFMNVKK